MGTKQIAEDSDKTKKAREKLKKRYDNIKSEISPEAISSAKGEIRDWIARHASDRVVLKDKLSLFDQNSNPADASGKVQKIAVRLKDENTK